MSLNATERPPRLRAPRASGDRVVDPAWGELSKMAVSNRERLRGFASSWFGISLVELANDGRGELASRALSYVRQYVGEPLDKIDVDAPLIVTGHQPGLVHPGVWLKNFAIDALARQAGGWGVHIVIDADLCRTSGIRVPIGSVAAPSGKTAQFDQASPPLPWEERTLLDQSIWQSFGERTSDAVATLVPNPLVASWWPSVAARGAASGRLGVAFSQSRHLLEREWGSKTLELPQSEVCQLRAFRLFAYRLLLEAPQFRNAHNAALALFRRSQKIRNHAHPVPDLGADSGWVETPLWVWSRSAPQRRPLWVRPNSQGLELSDRGVHHFALPRAGNSIPGEMLEKLAEWESAGVRIRSRALLTTLFLRLALADLFVHGIGGAHYDQVTDEIGERFFGAPLPPFATLSGTLQLPIAIPPAEDQRPHWRRRLRELKYHPEKFVNRSKLTGSEAEHAAASMATKAKWIETAQTPLNAAMRHNHIVNANNDLQHFVRGDRERAERELIASGDQFRIAQLLGSREFAFCLFPQTNLRRFVLDFA